MQAAMVALAEALAAGAERGTTPLLRATLWSTCGHLCVIAGILVAVAGLLLLTTAVGVGVLMRPTWRPALPAWVDRATLIGVVSLPLVVSKTQKAHKIDSSGRIQRHG